VTISPARTALLAAVLVAGSAALWLLHAQTSADAFDGTRPGAAREIGGLRFCWAPPGSFRMGSPPEEPERRDDEELVKVTVTRGFWMGKYEVTQGEWSMMMGAFRREPDKGRGPDVPVYWVSWLDANEFCRRSRPAHERTERFPKAGRSGFPPKLSGNTPAAPALPPPPPSALASTGHKPISGRPT